MLMVAAARVMANQGIGGDDDDDDDDDSWCDDIPCVDGDIIGQWDYLTRTYDSPSFLNAPTPPLHHGQHESEQVPYLHSMGIAGAEQRADIPGSHGCALGHFDESVLSNKRRNLHGAAVALDPIQHVSAPEPLFRLQRSSLSARSTNSGAIDRRTPTTNGSTTAEESHRNHEAMNDVFTPRFLEMLPSNCVPNQHCKVDSSRAHLSMGAVNAQVLPIVMCPPLTAYNYYYRNERDTIVQGMTHADDHSHRRTGTLPSKRNSNCCTSIVKQASPSRRVRR
jgi:hypothetical protein